PMVLGPKGPGRVGRRQAQEPLPIIRWWFFYISYFLTLSVSVLQSFLQVYVIFLPTPSYTFLYILF
ncbi:hypothetical protein, partial [Paenibacillus turicensis]|uniref:hypothetical protein n=1 Tax=Paenibacillus turicensis TaxID=160487 RepID=UPI001AE451C3